ncbi:hypothetical protein [Streptomyces stelliscabiei]|uniref:Uncharacterized protein n=1 Tax=Streptomyces stelliscabiei TaxID=146820 RepID=A0A8I0TYL7_9ACTN|nr:hypothetical protein [Streptomyces stelliscabiei]MBE1602543.1 hypothetical protein [Streptomyces stelliscabiei]MDX2516763.1 hypothetical protein [Streptomyces stelliscabiei]
MNADDDSPSRDLSTWTIQRLRSFADATHGPQLESVRVVAQGHAYDADAPRAARRQWAELSLRANQRLPGDSPWDRARKTHHDFMLRMWVIDQLGPDHEHQDWNPETLPADTIAALAFTPVEARALADHWRDLPVERIGELRRHKNLPWEEWADVTAEAQGDAV